MNNPMFLKRFTASPIFFFLLISVMMAFTACSKDDDSAEPTTNNTSNSTASTTPTFADGKGALIAVQTNNVTNTPIGPVTTTLGTAVAVFYDDPSASTFLSAGEVKAEGKTLTINPNNSYTFQPDATDPTGIDFSSDVNWEVSGEGNVPAINETITMGFPTVDAIDSEETVSKSNGYTLSSPDITGADSVLFLVGSIVRSADGSASSYSFTASDLSGLATGASIAQIAAYKVEERTTNGMKYHYVNETVISKTITIE